MPVFFQIRFSNFSLFPLDSCQKPSKNRFFEEEKHDALNKRPQFFNILHARIFVKQESPNDAKSRLWRRALTREQRLLDHRRGLEANAAEPALIPMDTFYVIRVSYP